MLETSLDAFGRHVISYDGIPVITDDWLPIDETQGTESAASSIWAVKFGSDGVMGLENGGIQVELVGEVQDQDATRHRIKWYTGLAIFSDYGLAKVWRRAGVEVATPDDRATADSVTVALSYSVDGGATWTSVSSSNLTSSSSRLATISAGLTARPQSRFIQLKLAVSSVSAWCPVVVGLWAEHETMDLPTRRRRWRFTLELTDQVVKRDSSVDSTGARTLATNLWDVWDNGSVVTFKDVDYDQTTTSYNVRIAGIREVIKKLTDVSIASSEVELTLVEV